MVVTPRAYAANVCSLCDRWEAKTGGGTLHAPGPVAQFGSAAPWHGEGRRFKSGQVHPYANKSDTLGYTLGGLVAGEGSFLVLKRGVTFRGTTVERLKFSFQLSLVTLDRPLLQTLRAFLGAGSIYDAPARNERWQPVSTLNITSERAHLDRTIPFAERYLLASAKRHQFESWRDRLFEYRATRPTQWGRGRSTCSIDACDKPVRGRGLCRSHYYQVTGY